MTDSSWSMRARTSAETSPYRTAAPSYTSRRRYASSDIPSGGSNRGRCSAPNSSVRSQASAIASVASHASGHCEKTARISSADFR